MARKETGPPLCGDRGKGPPDLVSGPIEALPTSPDSRDQCTAELATIAGAVAALRRRAAVQRKKAADGTSAAGASFPTVSIRSPEAALAGALAVTFEALAAELEGGALS